MADMYETINNHDRRLRQLETKATNTGAQGTIGFQGTGGTQGITGSQGDKGGLRYAFSTTITMADPGTGTVRFNSGTFGSITAIAIDDLDKNSVDVSNYIISWDDSGTSLDRGTIEIKSNVNGVAQIALFRLTALTDNAGWTQLTVAPLSGSVPADAAELVVSFHRTGLQGTTGTAGAAGATGLGDWVIRSSNGTASASATAIFNSANDAFSAAANKRYYFAGEIYTTTAIVSSVPTGVDFLLAGTATLSNVYISFISFPSTIGSISGRSGESNSTTTTIVGTSSSAQVSVTQISGTFTTGASSGTIIPQIDSSDPSTVRADAGTWFRIVELGSDTATEFGGGGWA